jgi:DNA-binding CsgD family transcriptional regulator
LLLHLGRRLRGARVFVVGACRPIDPAGSQSLTHLFAALRREEIGDRLDLAPLTLAEQARLIEAVSGQAPAAAVAAALHARSNGNPFFLQEMVCHLRAEAHDLGDPETAICDWHVPAGVREVIAARLARLSPAANRLLQAAAVVGEGVPFDVLGDVAAIEPSTLLDGVEEVTAAGFLREQRDGYDFGHALIRQAVHDALSLPRRQALHRRAAEALERRSARDPTPHLPALARHYRLAGEASAERALLFARRAAEAAAAVYAWEEAAHHWQAALALLPSGATAKRGELLLALGEAHQRAAAPAVDDAFRQAADLGRRLGDGTLLARAAFGYAGAWATFGRSDAATVALLEEALARLGEADSALRCRLLGRLAMELLPGDADPRREALSAEAVTAARRLGDAPTLAHALNARHHVLSDPRLLTQRLALATEMVAVAEAAGEHELIAFGRVWRIMHRLEQGDLAGVDRELTAFVELASALRQPALVWRAALLRAMRALLTGRCDEAERLVAQAPRLPRGVQGTEARLYLAAQRQILKRQRGGADERDLVAARRTVEEYPFLVGPRCWTAQLALELSHPEEARHHLERLAAQDFADLPRDYSLLPSLANLADVCAELGDQRRAAILYERLRPFADRLIAPNTGVVCIGVGAYFLARLATTLGRWEGADAHFQAAEATYRRQDARAFLAQTWFERGRMLLARQSAGGRPSSPSGVRTRRAAQGDHTGGAEVGAAALIGQALALAEELGMAPLVQQARELLDRAGARAGSLPAPPSTALGREPFTTLPDGLTAREVEVLGLLASGLTNKEIAAALVVSDRTVSTHVANLYGKIGARRRADATAYALRHGLLPFDAAEA